MTEYNPDKLQAAVGEVLRDLGGAYSVALVRLGDRLGLYRALYQDGPANATELAERTQLAVRYVREWAAHQAASGYITYDPTSERFTLTPEHAQVFAEPNSPVHMVAAFDNALSLIRNQPMVEEAFRTGGGVAWKDQASCMFCAVANFFRPGYQHSVVQSWIPSIEGLVEKLREGARVADVGCGHGFATQMIASAFPNAEVWGFDFHEASIAAARAHADKHQLGDRLRFEVREATALQGGPYDLITTFDCLHDMGDPQAAAAQIRSQLAPGGVWMIVEPFAGDRLEDNLNPVGRLYYAASTMICLPTSLAQRTGAALGAQAGERRLRQIIEGAGFESVRRTTETPFNIVLAARTSSTSTLGCIRSRFGSP